MIYCVEDDSSIRELMLYALRASGFTAQGYETAALFWEAIRREKPELILLDIMLPDEDGITVLKKLKNDPILAQIPVIMATAKSMEFDKVIGLDAGADDYLAKPFGMMEMVSRVKAVLRRSGPVQSAALLELGGLVLDPNQHTVTLAGQRVTLTYKEYELLKLFLTHPGAAFSRERLLHDIWNTDYAVETRTVDMHIRTLRQKLGDWGQRIETVRGVGYRLEGNHDR